MKANERNLDEQIELQDRAEGTETLTASVSEAGLKALQQERDALFDRLARLQAEFENFRKRSMKEQQDFRDFATAETAKSLLPVLDNLDLALKSPGSAEDLRKGVELIRKQFTDVLERMGVRPIEADGQLFDPQVHEAIEMVHTDEAPDHTVIGELQRGYRLKDRLLRPAMVRVAQNAHKK